MAVVVPGGKAAAGGGATKRDLAGDLPDMVDLPPLPNAKVHISAWCCTFHPRPSLAALVDCMHGLSMLPAPGREMTRTGSSPAGSEAYQMAD